VRRRRKCEKLESGEFFGRECEKLESGEFFGRECEKLESGEFENFLGNCHRSR